MLKALFTLVIVIQISFTAEAYRLYTTPNGAYVRWNMEDIELVLDPSLESIGSMDDVEAAFQSVIALWENEAAVPVHFNLVRGDCNDLDNDGNNCIFACRKGASCPRDERDKGATTFLSVSPESGVIQDMDMLFNAVDWKWNERSHASHTLNLRTVAAHELGHALGLDHSAEKEAAMYPTICSETPERTSLHNDDIMAATALYEDFTPISSAAGCTVSGVGRSGDHLMGWIVLLLGCGWIIRRGRKETR